MADNIELIMRFHPVGGQDISVLSTVFDSEAHALEAIAGALDGQRGLVLARARYNR
jgi:GTP-sensing pleiotropic transcriptional regulator CodY